MNALPRLSTSPAAAAAAFAGVDIVESREVVRIETMILRGKADGAVARDAARRASGAPQIVEVRDRLPHREEALLQVERAAEQHRYHLLGGHRRVRRCQRRVQLGKALGMM